MTTVRVGAVPKRRMTVKQLQQLGQRAEHLEAEIQRLADRILKIDGEPSIEGGAVDAAIHLLDELETRRTMMEGLTEKQIEKLTKQARRRSGLRRLGMPGTSQHDRTSLAAAVFAGVAGVAVGAVLARSPQLTDAIAPLLALPHTDTNTKGRT